MRGAAATQLRHVLADPTLVGVALAVIGTVVGARRGRGRRAVVVAAVVAAAA